MSGSNVIRLGLLGSPSVQNSAGESVDGLVAQPKRLALLAYLALIAPGAESREHLFSVFWPESDPSHARLSLRQAIHFVRTATAAPDEGDILVARGKGMLAVNAGRVWCDANEFESRLAAGDYAGALALYRGDFLSGVSGTGDGELQRWLDRERTRLRSAAEVACLRAAEVDLACGSIRGALYWARRGEALAPANESFTRLQLMLTEGSGDWQQAV